MFWQTAAHAQLLQEGFYKETLSRGTLCTVDLLDLLVLFKNAKYFSFDVKSS
jgi:hypothetical protein